MRFDFVLVDLHSQRHAVMRHTADMSQDEILAWMRRHGEVFGRSDLRVPNRYAFISVSGISWGFHFDEHGKIKIF